MALHLPAAFCYPHAALTMACLLLPTPEPAAPLVLTWEGRLAKEDTKTPGCFLLSPDSGNQAELLETLRRALISQSPRIL